MSYTDFTKFREHYEVAHLASQAYHGNNTQTKFVQPEIAWQLYQNSGRASMGFQTFGRHITGDKAKELRDFRQKKGQTAQLPRHLVGMNHGESFFKNFKTVNDGHDQMGSILLMGGGKWNFTVNDSWLLGGIHARLQFYPASIIYSKNIFDSRYILTITGRELLGLALFGYREQTGHKDLGSVYYCAEFDKADNATLTDYQLMVASIKTVSQAKFFFKSKGFRVG